MAKSETALIAIAYRYFMAVAETGSVRAASRALNVAASAISRQLMQLEASLGATLFDRSGRGLSLTPAGAVLLRGLRQASQGHENTLDELSALKGLKRGLLRTATVESVSVSMLPDMLLDFAGSFPGIEVAVAVAGSEAVTSLVREHQADLGFTFNPSSLEGLEVLAARDLHLGAVLAPAHPLARSGKLSLSDCAAFPLAWPSQGLSLRAILDSAPAARKLRPAFECNSLRLMASLARRGSCIAFQTVIGIEQELGTGKLVFVPLTDKRLPVDRLLLVARAGAASRPAAEAFVTLAQRHLPEP
ncbi:LysR family transcriptional regulator [Aestuariivirga sp.]|uniref:LysR family transcriptional regulator n=1 Tax=Aestuariivirga sp. TaxID=2650926 RepID=UPI003BAC5643